MDSGQSEMVERISNSLKQVTVYEDKRLQEEALSHIPVTELVEKSTK